MNIYTKNLSSELWLDFERYFEFGGNCSECWCMDHRMPFGLNITGQVAKTAMEQLIKSDRVKGVLAYVEGDATPVGWAALDRRNTLPGHDCIGEDLYCRATTWSIHCVTARADHRNRGIEKILTQAAVDLAVSLKAEIVHSYPEPGSKEGDDFTTWNSFSGFQSNYDDTGFIPIESPIFGFENAYTPMQLFLETRLAALRTTRLKIEPQTLQHVEKLYEPFKEEALYRYINREPLVNREQLRTGIRSLANRMLPNKTSYCLNWVLIASDTNEVVGQVEVSMPVNGYSFYLAYTIFKHHWKQGYGKEACLCIITYMFKTWKAHKVIIEMDVRNTASIRLAESLGAKCVAFNRRVQLLKGEWSDEYRYELCRRRSDSVE